MATVSNAFNIPKAKGRGEYKLIHATYSNADFGSALYPATGGLTLTIPDAKSVITPLGACLVSSDVIDVVIGSYSGAAVNCRLVKGGTEQSGLAISGAVVLEIAAICEPK